MKKITITVDEKGIQSFDCQEMPSHEILGLLRFWCRKVEYNMIVDACQQDKKTKNMEPNPRITINDFIEKSTTISTRLINVLKSTERVYDKDYNTIGVEPIFNYLDEVTKFKFLKTRNAGLKSWGEFCDLLSLHNNNNN